MPGQTYNQYGALARALDRVGKGWARLMLRELFTGSRRCSDFLPILPGGKEIL